MHQSPIDQSLIVIIGTSGINWVTEDCGDSVQTLNDHSRPIQEFLFHPDERTWALASSWTTCAQFINEPCRIYKKLYYTKDLGHNWVFITDYVYDFEWGQTTATSSKFKEDHSKYVKFPSDRIFLTRDTMNRYHQHVDRRVHKKHHKLRGSKIHSHQQIINGFIKDIDIDLYYSDNYFNSRPVLALKDGG